MPLYEAVYERLDVGPGTRVLGLGCGSGLALLMAASRGAALTGVESASPSGSRWPVNGCCPRGGRPARVRTHGSCRARPGTRPGRGARRTPW